MKLLIAGGGTGGHLFAGIAVAEDFLKRNASNEVLFVGTRQGIEATVIPKKKYPLHLIWISLPKGTVFAMSAIALSSASRPYF